ncbi:glycosyltransferase family 4 protein [Caballeronia sp. LjRoot29]|uniref:glycosyltransferase family 4 protein n=1 Tax=Caballeronia sp. LjRoot29 TaxID=3342315 RepID=UPI003ECF0292
MKVLIVNNMAPFLWGGAEELALNLQKQLVIAGHGSEILRIPFQWEPATQIPSQMLMVRALELWNVDHVIALKFPAFYIRHPNKTMWLVHQYRQSYDLYDVGQTNLPLGKQGEDIRTLIANADNEAFAESKRVFTISEVTRQRLKKYNGFDATVLVPPTNDPELFLDGQAGDYIFAGGRINQMKRQHLLLDAMTQTDPNVKLIIAGPPDSPADGDSLRVRVERLGLGDRVKLDLRFLPRETYANYLKKAAAVAYLPYDEDALAYVTMEAATAGKALITASDSGGVLGLVKPRETGWVAEPSPESLADAMNAVFADTALTRRYGDGARELLNSLGITWAKTVETLLQ